MTASGATGGAGGDRKRRKASFHRGQWAVQRERLQVEDELPPPGGGTERFDAVLARVAQQIGIGEVHWLATIEEQWLELAGATVAAHARPGAFERGVLTVFLDSPVWLSELQRYGSKVLLANLQRRYGNRIRELRFRLDPARQA